MRDDILKRRVEIELWISQLRPKSHICRDLNCRPATLDAYLRRFGLTYTGNMGGKGFKLFSVRKLAAEYLFDGSTISSHKLKLKLLNDNYKQKKCESCHMEKWLGKAMPLELHHVNGNRFDNRLSNLQLLCPNCHALTDNYSGRRTRKS